VYPKCDPESAPANQAHLTFLESDRKITEFRSWVRSVLLSLNLPYDARLTRTFPAAADRIVHMINPTNAARL
jgi:hypothetical protein